MSYEALWLRYFALTVVVELAVAVPLLRGLREPRELRDRDRDRDRSVARRALAVAVANLASHPLVWFVLARVISSRAVMVPVAEAWAIGSEAVVYALVFPSLPRSRALGTSAMANAASFLLGTVLTRL